MIQEESGPVRRLAVICTVVLLGVLVVMTILEIRSLLIFPRMDF